MHLFIWTGWTSGMKYENENFLQETSSMQVIYVCTYSACIAFNSIQNLQIVYSLYFPHTVVLLIKIRKIFQSCKFLKDYDLHIPTKDMK